MYTPRKPPAHLAQLHKTLLETEKAIDSSKAAGFAQARRIVRQMGSRTGSVSANIKEVLQRRDGYREHDAKFKTIHYETTSAPAWAEQDAGLREALRIVEAYEEAGLC